MTQENKAIETVTGGTALAIRPYVDSDADRLFDLSRDWGPDHAFSREVFDLSLRGIAADPNSRLLVAEFGPDLVGYAQLVKCFYVGMAPFYEITQLLVAQSRRSAGVGAGLLRASEDIALEEGIHQIKLSSQVHRSRAHVFYEREGYDYFKISKFFKRSF